MKILFSVFYLVFLVFAVIYQIFIEEKTDAREKESKGKIYFHITHRLINISYVSLVFFPPIEYFIIKRQINPFVSILGIVMVYAGILGRNYAIKFLKKYWSGDIEIKHDHKIIKEGPYAYMRHPAYTAMLLNGIGLCLIPNAYYSLILAFVFYVPVILVRIKLEENVLIQKFGSEYLDYKNKKFAFFPFKKKAV